jgi:Flp pilus assembly protein TadG
MGAWLRGRPAGCGGSRGQVLVLFALGLVALLGAAGIAFDAGRFLMERRSLQNAADSAALAAANSLIRGGSTTDADTEARAVLATNLANGPNGIVAPLPPASPVYAPGGAGDPEELQNGILISGGEVRVAVQNTIPFTFGRAVGLVNSVVGARARVLLQGDLLPIAVRHYINMPGPNAGATTPCSINPGTFIDTFATETTSCLGTDADPTLRSVPNVGAAFDITTPGSDPTNHGPIVEILGQGAQPNGSSDFRGFVALDIRNFAAFGTQIYYNNVTSGTQRNTLKAMEAGWISAGGYPGPMFPPAVTPPDPNDQVAVMSGNATGIAIDALNQRFGPGDAILVAVYPGQVMAIPDFTLGTPPLLPLAPTGTLANGGSFRVGRNQAFSGQVTLSTLADTNDPNNPMVLGTLVGGDPITYGPNPVTPSLGAGTSVGMSEITTIGAAPGIYALWIKGQAGSPYLTTKHEPLAVKIGSVSRDFGISSDVSAQNVVMGAPATFRIAVKDAQNQAFGGSVALSLEGLNSPLPGGVTASFSPATVTPLGTTSKLFSSTLTVGTTGLGNGTHRFVVRVTGTNGEATPRSVTRLYPIEITIGDAAASAGDEYVDIVGFAVMRIATADSNTVTAYAITPLIADMNDPALRRGQVARLVPWD